MVPMRVNATIVLGPVSQEALKHWTNNFRDLPIYLPDVLQSLFRFLCCVLIRIRSIYELNFNPILKP
jgi:hypothetical protein